MSMPTPPCSMSKMMNSAPALLAIWQNPGVKNSAAMMP